MNKIQKYESYCIGVRRYFHMHPEIGYHLEKTTSFIIDELDKLGVSYVKVIGGGSIVVSLGNGKPIIGIRADIDALEIQEENYISYKSTYDGKMHACGHDCHAAILLTLIKYIIEEKVEFNGTLKCIFQDAEELTESGGLQVIESGIVDDVDIFLSFHVDPRIPVGKVGLKYGEFNASCDDFIITLIGKGGHAAYPQYAIDPIQMFNEVYMHIQNMKARELTQTEKSVIAISKVNAGHANNIIPNSLTFEGTVRTFNEDIRKKIKERIEEIVHGITNIHHGKNVINYIMGLPALFNSFDVCRTIEEVIKRELGCHNFVLLDDVSMGSDDFSYYSNKAKGAMMALGVRNEELGYTESIHNSKFMADEKSLIIGVKIYLEIIKKIFQMV